MADFEPCDLVHIGNIRFFEYSREDDNLFPLSEHSSREAQRGMSFLPRRALETSENEIARAFKLSGNTLEPLGFIVPRKADNFQVGPPSPLPSSIRFFLFFALIPRCAVRVDT